MHTDLLLVLLLRLIHCYVFRWLDGLVDRVSCEGVVQVLPIGSIIVERESLVTSQMVIGGSASVA